MCEYMCMMCVCLHVCMCAHMHTAHACTHVDVRRGYQVSSLWLSTLFPWDKNSTEPELGCLPESHSGFTVSTPQSVTVRGVHG